MASPQAENGALKIAYELFGAMVQHGLTGLQLHVLLVIMALSYGRDRTKAKMSIEDIRSVLGAYGKYRRYRFVDTLAELHAMRMITLQDLGDDTYILGPQKDYDRWTVDKPNNDLDGPTDSGAKNLQLLHTGINSISSNTIQSMPQIICTYAYADHPYKPTGLLLKKEIAVARELYGKALIKYRIPRDATYLLKDFIDSLTGDETFRSKVRLIFAYGKTRFRQYAEAIPTKPYTVKQDEQSLGFRHRWDHKLKRWRITDDRI